MTHEKEIKELIELGEKITNNEWFNVTIKDASHVENEGILSTKIKGVELEEEVILLSCQEDLDGNAWNNMRFIANAANSRTAIKAMYEENKKLRYCESRYKTIIECQQNELRIYKDIDRSLSEKKLSELSSALESEKDMNAALTEENQKLELRIEELEKWQPIETAPKDGKLYLGAIGKGTPFTAYYDEDDGHRCEFQTDIALHVPTHWKPLPTPPQPTDVTKENE